MAVPCHIHVLILFVIIIEIGDGHNDQSRILSRKKRYLVFPEGSTLSVSFCMTDQTNVTPGQIFTQAINWSINYNLPNDTDSFKDLLDKPKKLMQMRHRRELYTKFETVMRSMGYDGRSCILRALCEASRKLKPKGGSLVEEIIRIVFRYPRKHEIRQIEDHYQYYGAAQKGIDYSQEECSDAFPRCPFSLIDLALGYYSIDGY